LSSIALILIIVGAVLFAVIAAVLIGLYFLKQRRNSGSLASPSADNQPQSDNNYGVIPPPAAQQQAYGETSFSLLK